LTFESQYGKINYKKKGATTMEALKELQAIIDKHGYRKFIIGLMLMERDLTEEDCNYDYDMWMDSIEEISFLNDILSGSIWKDGE
jgi:hypothetical protein